MTVPTADQASEVPFPARRKDFDNGPPADLDDYLAQIERLVPPLWPLADYVAVNPFLGFSGDRFLAARQTLTGARQCDILPSAAYLSDILESGKIPAEDYEAALLECQEEYPDWYADANLNDLLSTLRSTPTESQSPNTAERQFMTIAEVVDAANNTRWTNHIITDISRHCAAHYDRGQAAWPSPWKGLPLYEAWLRRASRSKRLDRLGIKGFRSLMGFLPSEPRQAIRSLLEMLEMPQQHWHGILMSQMMSISGWASFIRFQTWNMETPPRTTEDLVGLLAIRLTCDVALAKSHNLQDVVPLLVKTPPSATKPLQSVLARYLVQRASEVHYRRKLLDQINRRDTPVLPSTRQKRLHMAFCIDVRSEVYRRHLEAQNEAIRTSGFAGFFGMPLEFVRLGASWGAAHCPVLITPSFTVEESLQGAPEHRTESVAAYRKQLRKQRKAWKVFQTSSISCFSYVESLGLGYVWKLFTDSLGLTPPVSDPSHDGLSQQEVNQLGPDLDRGDFPLPIESRVELAEGMLRNLGLVDQFADVIALCGHASTMVNNPYHAGYDCGACGGHSGEPNARVAASILNDPDVRSSLAEKNIRIPENTWFIAAVHRTTTDEIEFFETSNVPDSHRPLLGQVKKWTAAASEAARHERSGRMQNASGDSILYRSRDWSEVRPEWGLAGNAAFIVGDRRHTTSENLQGRVFLHDYSVETDPTGNVLQAIMTAPMVVTSWINLQYYASAADNQAFGSGSKVIHDVVGQLGIAEGNGGDLRTGLPWQAVHDGQRFQHEPLRLLVVIEAQREAVTSILTAHENLHALVTHGWIYLVVREGNTDYRWSSREQWIAV